MITISSAMRKVHHALALALVLILWAGCVPKSKIHMDTLSQISRELSSEEVTKKIAKTPSMVLHLNDTNNSMVQVFEMVTGTETVYGSMYMPGVNGAPGYSIPTTTIVDVTESYFLLYHADQLEFWGFLEEFGRSEDPEIRKYRPLIDDAFKVETSKREQERLDELGEDGLF